jgi:hypothetical protein
VVRIENTSHKARSCRKSIRLARKNRGLDDVFETLPEAPLRCSPSASGLRGTIARDQLRSRRIEEDLDGTTYKAANRTEIRTRSLVKLARSIARTHSILCEFTAIRSMFSTPCAAKAIREKKVGRG